MSDKREQLDFMLDSGVIAIVRANSSAELMDVADAIKRGGVNVIEITMTTPNALEVISDVSRKFAGDVLAGAGSVLDAETARAAILAGAEFIVAPTLSLETIALCNRYGKVVVPGTLTPTEILTAWEAGADLVKVFPASLGGPSYIKAVKAPLPQVQLVPVGGVNVDNTGDFIEAGAAAVAVGGSLVNSKLIAEGKFDEMTETAQKLIDAVRAARGK
jgi:2-dehydro-3-deoxyphosphogluconate aldolase/(4S)-4-hydroxy-2-oxoglutarate aldolase